MIRSLGIDIGQTVTGFAVVDRGPDDKGRCGQAILLVKHLAPPKGPERLPWLREMTRGLVREFSVDVVGYEQACYPRNMAVFRTQAQLAGAIEEACNVTGMLCVAVAPTTAKKRLTGSGKAKKPEMIAAAEKLVGREVTEDEADALGVALAAADMVEERS